MTMATVARCNCFRNGQPLYTKSPRCAQRGLSIRIAGRCYFAPQHFLYFLPLPHGHGSLRPTFGVDRRAGCGASSPPE